MKNLTVILKNLWTYMEALLSSAYIKNINCYISIELCTVIYVYRMHFLYIHTCNIKQPIILKRVSINTRMLYAFIQAH